jgi:lipoprotein-anchoring transpeptidase ErfK/SrfK
MPGTIVIRTGERRLYYVVGAGEAIRYPVGVGRAGMQWSGTASINGKYIELRELRKLRRERLT